MHDALAALRTKRLFFIGGAPKSGTTWLQLLLDAHPEISCRGEGHMVNHLGPLLVNATNAHNAFVAGKNASLFPGLHGHPLLTEADLLYLLGSTIGLMLLRPEKAGRALVVGEKTPNNITHFSLLHRLFPNAVLVHLVRDGRDCATSAWFHRLRLNPAELSAGYSSMAEYLPHAAEAWIQVVQTGLEFAAAHPQSCVTIRYEDLSRAPEATLGALLRVLGASTQDDVIRTCCAAAEFRALSGGRRPGEEDRMSFFRHGTVGNWHQHFDQASQAIFQAKAGVWLSRLGY